MAYKVYLHFSSPAYSELAYECKTRKQAENYTEEYPLFMPGTRYEIVEEPV